MSMPFASREESENGHDWWVFVRFQRWNQDFSQCFGFILCWTLWASAIEAQPGQCSSSPLLLVVVALINQSIIQCPPWDNFFNSRRSNAKVHRHHRINRYIMHKPDTKDRTKECLYVFVLPSRSLIHGCDGRNWEFWCGGWDWRQKRCCFSDSLACCCAGDFTLVQWSQSEGEHRPLPFVLIISAAYLNVKCDFNRHANS